MRENVDRAPAQAGVQGGTQRCLGQWAPACAGEQEKIATAALDLINTPFRLHGRNPATGVDCVGLVLHALAAAGVRPDMSDDYRVLVSDPAKYRGWAERAGLVARADDDATQPGDIIAVRPGPLQLHLMVAVERGHVHAHGGLGRVVLMPGALPWPVWGRWRVVAAE